MAQPLSDVVPPVPRTPAPPTQAQTTPSCTRCASADTDVVMMRHHTCDADDWVVCNECGYVFSPSRWPEFR